MIFFKAPAVLYLYFSDAACNSRFSPGSLETGAPAVIEWITCCGNYKHWAGIYIRHPVEKCTTLMALSERWSNKISFVYKTYFIKVSALLHSRLFKSHFIHLQIELEEPSVMISKHFNYKDTVILCLTSLWFKLLPLNLIFFLMENCHTVQEIAQTRWKAFN